MVRSQILNVYEPRSPLFFLPKEESAKNVITEELVNTDLLHILVRLSTKRTCAHTNK